MAVHIHPTAIVDANAALDDNVTIGPFCLVGPGAFIGSGTVLHNNVTLMGNVRIGHDNVIYPNCVIGAEPQDRSYRGSPTWVVIGDRNVIRENVTIHRGTEKELGITRLGSDNFLMAGCHLAHDVVVGSHVYIANNTLLSGHVHVHDHATMSGMIGVHHFCTIGSFSFIGGLSRITTDIPPYMLAEGNPSVIRCVNLVGLKRLGMSQVDIKSLTVAHRLLYRVKMGSVQAKKTLISNGQWTPPVENLFAFLESQHQGRNGRGREGKRAA